MKLNSASGTFPTLYGKAGEALEIPPRGRLISVKMLHSVSLSSGGLVLPPP